MSYPLKNTHKKNHRKRDRKSHNCCRENPTGNNGIATGSTEKF